MARIEKAEGDMIKLFSGDDMHRLSGKLMEMGGKIVCIKCGYRGIMARTAGVKALESVGKAAPHAVEHWANRELWQPALSIDVLPNATGSGDSCIAGFLSAYLRGLSLEDCLRYAAAVGAHNVMKPDALSGVKTWEETTVALDHGWAASTLNVEGSGWHRADASRWRGPADSQK